MSVICFHLEMVLRDGIHHHYWCGYYASACLHLHIDSWSQVVVAQFYHIHALRIICFSVISHLLLDHKHVWGSAGCKVKFGWNGVKCLAVLSQDPFLHAIIHFKNIPFSIEVVCSIDGGLNPFTCGIKCTIILMLQGCNLIFSSAAFVDLYVLKVFLKVKGSGSNVVLNILL